MALERGVRDVEGSRGFEQGLKGGWSTVWQHSAHRSLHIPEVIRSIVFQTAHRKGLLIVPHSEPCITNMPFCQRPLIINAFPFVSPRLQLESSLLSTLN